MGRYNFRSCNQTVVDIMAGNRTLGTITNSTIDEYIWQGHVTGLLPEYPRSDYLALTYRGCTTICGAKKIQLNDTAHALNIAATWIFPLAILFSLPFDSLHRKKVRKTLEATSNWLGSPQTVLTATLFNFRQIRECHRRAKEEHPDRQNVANNTFYVLSCLNQFELPQSVPQHLAMLRVLIYALFPPLSNQESDEVIILRQQLGIIAHQLRMQRRKSVIPTFASLATFLVAFVFSVVLAFAELGDNSTAHSLALGLLLSWLPILVIFTIVDRNPTSADRTATLLSRWLHNVNAVRSWKIARLSDRDLIAWWTTADAGSEPYRIGHFIGQGRKMQYAGLASAVLEETDDIGPLSTIKNCNAVADRVEARLKERPTSWKVLAGVALCIVSVEMMMAFMVAFRTPTVGLGCRSFSILLVAIFSNVSWFFSLIYRSPPPWMIRICHAVNAFVIFLLVAIIGFQLTGGMNSCWCKASMLNFPTGLGGYVDFEGANFYRTYFNVTVYWAVGTTVGGLVLFCAFIVAIFQWRSCQHLWSANERTINYPLQPVQPNTHWLQ